MVDVIIIGAEVVSKLNKMAASIDLNEPWNHPKAKEWDGQTFESWIRKSAFTNMTKQYLRRLSEAVYSAESSDFSFLHFLFGIKTRKNEQFFEDLSEGEQFSEKLKRMIE